MKTKPLLDRVFADWPAKILSLLGAVALFFFYQVNKLEERSLSVPLVVLTNDEFVAASQYPRTVRLVLRGESNAIGAILEGDLEATLDLSGYTSAGVWRVPVRVERRGSALDVDPLEIEVEPADVALSIELRSVRQLKVVPSFRGFLEPGYELVGYEIDPPDLEAVGPASLMARVADVTTEPIELSGKSGDFSAKVRIQRRDPLIGLLSSDLVEFRAQVRKAMVMKKFLDVPIGAMGLPEGLAVSGDIPLATIMAAASRTEMEAFILGPEAVVMDLSAVAGPGTYTVAVTPRFPEGFVVESWSPQTVVVTIEQSGQGHSPDKGVSP